MFKMRNKEKSENFNSKLHSNHLSAATMFAIKESYKTIRTNILLNLDEKPCHTIVVTSSLSGEGKSTSSINVAISISQFEKKVLMIDADLRKSKASKYMNLNSTLGLSDILKKEKKFEEVVNNTNHQNLHFLSSGTRVYNPADMLGSKAMSNLLQELSTKYDFIIIDTPPVNVVSDALPLIRQSDGVVLVAREMVVTNKDFKKLLTNLDMIKANILGLIYIGTDSTQPYYHSRDYYGKYGRYSSYAKKYGYDKYNDIT